MYYTLRIIVCVILRYYITAYWVCVFHQVRNSAGITRVVVCTDLWGKEPDRQVGVGIVVRLGKSMYPYTCPFFRKILFLKWKVTGKLPLSMASPPPGLWAVVKQAEMWFTRKPIKWSLIKSALRQSTIFTHSQQPSSNTAIHCLHSSPVTTLTSNY